MKSNVPYPVNRDASHVIIEGFGCKFDSESDLVVSYRSHACLIKIGADKCFGVFGVLPDVCVLSRQCLDWASPHIVCNRLMMDACPCMPINLG